MADASPVPYRAVFLVLGLMAVISGIRYQLDVRNQTYTGFLTDGNNIVISVEAGGPAAAGGLQVGDAVQSMNNVSVQDTRATLALARAKVGDSWPYVVSRGGQPVTLNIVQGAFPAKDVAVARATFLLGLCFLGFCYWAYFTAPRAATIVLALFGLCFATPFLGGPYYESATVRNLQLAIIELGIFIGCAALLHFLLEFPERRRFLEKASGIRLLYMPALLMTVVFFLFLIVQPASTNSLNVFLRILFALVFGGYFLTSIVVLIRGYSSASPMVRAQNSMGLVALGTLVGLGPLLVSFVLQLVSPQTALPYAQYYFLTLGLIPITFSLAAVKGSRA
jgi:hypothetical protein